MLYSIIVILLFLISIIFIGLFSYLISRNIKQSSYISSTNYGELVQLLQDKHELHRFGYGQYLKRGYSDFNAFHMSFMSMGLIVSLIFLANYIFATVSISYALIIFGGLSLFYILTSISNAQLLANQPTSGGLYHVVYKQVGSIWASIVGGIKLIAQLASTVLYSFICIKLILLVFSPALYKSTIAIALGMVIVIFLQVVIANLKSALTRWMQGVGIILFWLLLLIVSVLSFLFILPNGYSPFYFLVGEHPFITSSQFNVSLAIAFVIILLAKCFVGHDEAANNAEETIEPRIKIPWATYLSTSYTVVFGFVFLMLIGIVYFNVTKAVYVEADLNEWLLGLLLLPNPVQISILSLLIIMSWYNGLFGTVNGSRHIMALARDGMLPFSNKLANITLIRQTPHYAIIFYGVLASCLALSYLSINQDFIFISQIIGIVVALYSLTYAITLFFAFFTKHDQKTFWSIKYADQVIRIISIGFNCVIATLAITFVKWPFMIIIVAIVLLNSLYTYLKHGYLKLTIQTNINKNEFELERNFPLQ